VKVPPMSTATESEVMGGAFREDRKDVLF